MSEFQEEDQKRVAARISTIGPTVVGLHLRHPVEMESSALFMDDTNLWAVEDTIEEVVVSLNTQVDRVVSWCRENDVLINAKKSVVLFNSPDEVATVRIAETEVSPSPSGKYLGFRFKSSKKYGQLLVDLKDVAIDIKRRTHLLRRVSFKLNSRELMMFGKALVMGKLNYYLPLLSAERSTGTLRCLDVALNDFMRVMTGLIKTTPVPLLHYFSGIPTLDILIRESSMRNFKRINLNSDCLIDQEYREWDGSNLGASPYFGFYLTNVDLQNTFPEVAPIVDEDPELLESAYWTKYSVQVNRDLACLAHKKNKLIPKADICLYTDGSLKRKDEHTWYGSAGWSILVDSQEVSIGCCQVDPATSSYVTEMAGLEQGIRSVIELQSQVDLRNKTVAVLSDSRSAVTHLQSVSLSNRRLNEETVRVLETIHDLRQCGIKSLELVWIPGHVGIEGNERADELADEGHKSDQVYEMGATPSALKAWIKRTRSNMMDDYLRDKVRDSKVHQDAPPRDVFRRNDKFPEEKRVRSRRSQVSLNRLRSGHVMCGLSSSRIFDDAEQECRWCKSHLESYEHVLMECPRVMELDHPSRTRLLEFDKSIPELLVSRKKKEQSAVFDLIGALEVRGAVF